jgi:hypothetical protein
MSYSLLIFFPLLALMLAISIIRYLRHRRRERNRHRRCPCGYIIENLTIPRCPECGRAIGFDVTFQELGITEQELQEAARRKALQGKLAENDP